LLRVIVQCIIPHKTSNLFRVPVSPYFNLPAIGQQAPHQQRFSSDKRSYDTASLTLAQSTVSSLPGPGPHIKMPSPSSTPANTIRHSLTPNFTNTISGAVAGILTAFVTCPLEVVKTRLQAQINSLHQVEKAGLRVPSGELYRGITASFKRIWKEEGIRGFYRGLGPVTVGCLPTWYILFSRTHHRAVYFPVYERCKLIYAAPGTFSFVVLCAMSYLFDRKSPSLRTMRTKDLDISDGFILFRLQFRVHKLILGRREYVTYMGAAMTAGVASAVITNPIWVIKTRLMVPCSFIVLK
jgi:hypothetical protein